MGFLVWRCFTFEFKTEINFWFFSIKQKLSLIKRVQVFSVSKRSTWNDSAESWFPNFGLINDVPERKHTAHACWIHAHSGRIIVFNICRTVFMLVERKAVLERHTQGRLCCLRSQASRIPYLNLKVYVTHAHLRFRFFSLRAYKSNTYPVINNMW